jgi:hypothetical protein
MRLGCLRRCTGVEQTKMPGVHCDRDCHPVFSCEREIAQAMDTHCHSGLKPGEKLRPFRSASLFHEGRQAIIKGSAVTEMEKRWAR